MLAICVPRPPNNTRKKPSTELDLIAATRQGDLCAFNQLVRSYQGLAYRTAFHLLGNSDAAADATQQAFILAYQHLKVYHGGSFKAWLLKIVTNACYDQLRDKRRQRTVSLDELSCDAERTTPDLARTLPESPQAAAERRELDELIQEGLQTLPPEQRLTLILADIQELAYAEIAEITDTNLGTVKSRLARGRASLREFLTRHQDFLPRPYQHSTRVPIPSQYP